MQAHILAQVKLTFSCGINPGCADIICSTPTHCPGFVKSYFLGSGLLPCFDEFVHQFVRCCAPNMQDSHGGGQYLRRSKCFGRSTAFGSQNIIEYGRWSSRWCMSINSCSAGFNDLGLRMDTSSWSLTCFDASWTSVKVVGSDAKSSGWAQQLAWVPLYLYLWSLPLVLHASLQPIAHVRPQFGYDHTNHRKDPHIYGAFTSGEWHHLSPEWDLFYCSPLLQRVHAWDFLFICTTISSRSLWLLNWLLLKRCGKCQDLCIHWFHFAPLISTLDVGVQLLRGHE